MGFRERLAAWLLAMGLMAAFLALPFPAVEEVQPTVQPPPSVVAAAPTLIPTSAAVPSPTWTPVPSVRPSPSPLPSPTVVPTPTPEPERWIEVILSTQTLNAYEGERLVRSWKVSTGLPRTPTPVGDFRIWVKLRYDDMEGPGYYLPNVPYVMYFYGGYGIHGVYWHANFGHPMSHGCINMPTDGAAWLFDWASVGTLVRIRP